MRKAGLFCGGGGDGYQADGQGKRYKVQDKVKETAIWGEHFGKCAIRITPSQQRTKNIYGINLEKTYQSKCQNNGSTQKTDSFFLRYRKQTGNIYHMSQKESKRINIG